MAKLSSKNSIAGVIVFLALVGLVVLIVQKAKQAPVVMVPVKVPIPAPVAVTPSFQCTAQIPGGVFGASCKRIPNDIQPIYTDRYMCDVFGADGGKLYTGPIESSKVKCN